MIETAPETPPIENRLARFFPEKLNHVLDCACGPAARVAHFRARGAAEINALTPLGENPRCEGYDNVHSCDLVMDSLPFPPDSYDFILCHDVLARLRDPAPLLQRLRRLLTASGQLLATVPNLQHHQAVVALAEGRWEPEAAAPLARQHIRFFTGPELLHLLQEAGFQVQRTSALTMDAPEVFPRDAENIVRLPRMAIGPLSYDEYKQFLVREYAFLATPKSE